MSSRICAVSILLLVNVCYFAQHYLGDFVFPWDFIGGYHAMAYAVHADGDLFAPELWSPYGNFGFPTHLAIQNSAFYPPLELLGWLEVPYTLGVAVWVQCLHVFAGAIGVYSLLRLKGIGAVAAITGGIVFQLSSGFFSNAQHVDIIRAYSLSPWVFIAVSHKFLVSPRRISVSAWILFAFLVGSYPGVVVATFYGSLVYVVLEMTEIEEWRDRRRYFGLLLGLGLLALMLSGIKFLPLAGMSEELLRHGRTRTILPEYLLTIFFRFDLDHLSGNLTMRTYYLPVTALILIGLTNKITRLWLTGLSLSLCALMFALKGSPIRGLAVALPGMSMSRFHVSDFRMLFHLGLILMACASLQSLIDRPPGKRQLAVRGVVLALSMWFLMRLALETGYTRESLAGELMIFAGSLGILLVAAILLSSDVKRLLRGCAIAGIWLATGYGAYTYAMHAPQTWRLDGAKPVQAESVLRGVLAGDGERQSLWPYRPGRIDRNSRNRGYYTQEFSATGRDSGLGLKRNLALHGELSNKPWSRLHGFLADRSRTVLVSTLEPQAVKQQLGLCSGIVDCPKTEDNSVYMLNFEISRSRFHVVSDGSRWLVENELYYPGWRSRVCRDQQCSEGPSAVAVLQSLRGWKLPRGEYELETYFEPPYWNLARALFWIAVSLTGLCCVRARPFGS